MRVCVCVCEFPWVPRTSSSLPAAHPAASFSLAQCLMNAIFHDLWQFCSSTENQCAIIWTTMGKGERCRFDKYRRRHRERDVNLIREWIGSKSTAQLNVTNELCVQSPIPCNAMPYLCCTHGSVLRSPCNVNSQHSARKDQHFDFFKRFYYYCCSAFTIVVCVCAAWRVHCEQIDFIIRYYFT